MDDNKISYQSACFPLSLKGEGRVRVIFVKDNYLIRYA
jgi:hypothetical protein